MGSAIRIILGLLNVFQTVKRRDEVGPGNVILNIIFGIVVLMVFGGGIVLVLAFAPTLFGASYLIQRAVVRKIDALMRSRADEARDKDLRATHPERTEASAVSGNLSELNRAETDSTTELGFTVYDAHSSMPKFADSRETMLQRAQADLNRKLVLDTGIGFAYLGVALVWYTIYNMNSPSLGLAGRDIGILILITVIIRRLFLAKQYRPLDAHFEETLSKSTIKLIGEPVANLLDNAGTVVLIVLFFVFHIFAAISANDYRSVLGLLVIGTLHFCFLVLSKPKTNLNIKLLLLRTFDIDRNTLFTFGRLINFWSHVGNHFTVVDRSYIRRKYAIKSQRTIGLLLFIMAMSLLLYYSLRLLFPALASDSTGAILGSLVLALVICPLLVTLLVIRFEYYQIERSFIKSHQAVQERIKQLQQRPRGLADSTFRGIPTMCHADTWQATVAEMVRSTDIVLMDLRGFSEEKKGCEFELDLLLDNFPVSHILILIDANDDEEYICKTITVLWKTLRVGSPNLNIPDPQIHVYKASQQNELDVQGIFDHLLGLASQPRVIQAVAAA